MKQQRKDLQPFDMVRLEEIRRLRDEMLCCGGSNYHFWDELQTILKSADYYPSNKWERMNNDDVVLGEVWSQPIGEFYYKNTVHKFTYLYVESQGLAIADHGHEELTRDGKQIRKIKEWYVFPNGIMELCDKDCKHRLLNDYGEPIYVISVKISRNGTT